MTDASAMRLTDVPRLNRLLGLVEEQDVAPVEAGLHAAAQNNHHLRGGAANGFPLILATVVERWQPGCRLPLRTVTSRAWAAGSKGSSIPLPLLAASPR